MVPQVDLPLISAAPVPASLVMVSLEPLSRAPSALTNLPPVTVRSALVLSVPVLTREPLTVIALLASIVPLLTNVPPSATSRPTLSVRLESLLVSLPAVLSSVPLPIVIVLWLASVPSSIVTVPEAFVNLSSNFLAQASSQVCSFWTVPATVLSVVLSAVTDGQLDIRFGFFGFAGHGACGEDGERGQDGRDERLPGEGGVAH